MADETTTLETPTPEAPPAQPDAATPEAVTEPTTPDAPTTETPDAFAALQAAMDAQLGNDTPADSAQPGDAKPEGQIPPEFQQALTISEFVKEPAHVEAAIRAADEVWKVANGQVPAATLLEGMRAGNPQGYQAVIENLIPYIEQVTGQKFGANPDAPPDPRDARLQAIEQQFAAEQEARQVQMWNQQVSAAHAKATEFIASKAKGTFAEGNEGWLLQMCGAKAGVSEQQMVNDLLQGRTDKLEAAYKAVLKDETARIRKYNENLIKNQRTLAAAVPGVKQQKADSAPARKPGEGDVEYATRLWNEGYAG